MASGYSGTPLAKKLGIKEGMTILPINPPENYRELLKPLPPDVCLSPKFSSDIDIVHLFTNTRDGLFQK
ncbi:MAG: DUF3052 domain-containing protein, partial [Acidobacteria bacterium]|nr:DUF3052 domain-containing protein [Acidobacteriota bacterium]